LTVGLPRLNKEQLDILKYLFRSVVPCFILGAAVFLSGCAAMIEAPIRDKTASIENVALPRKDLNSLMARLSRNTAFAFSGASGVRIMENEGAANEYIVQIIGDRPTIGGGLAAAVSEDGYYITASHVLEEGMPVLLVHDQAGEFGYELVREVWRAEDGRDLALLKGRPRKSCFPIALKIPAEGDVVVAAGASGGDSAGVVLGVDGEHILHSAPLRRGDSGGPLVNKNGALIGVNRAIHLDPFRGRRNEAIILDADEITRLILEDRRKNR
jgi:S1-C subfamily serine protease